MTDKTTPIHDQELCLLTLLKETRQAQNITIETVSEALKVKGKDVQFLEQSNAQDIAQYPHLSGLIRVYATFLAIDSNIVNQWMKNNPFKSNVSNKKYELLNIGENLDLKPNRDQFFNFMFISILLFFIFLVLYHFYEDNSQLIAVQQLVIELAK